MYPNELILKFDKDAIGVSLCYRCNDDITNEAVFSTFYCNGHSNIYCDACFIWFLLNPYCDVCNREIGEWFYKLNE